MLWKGFKPSFTLILLLVVGITNGLLFFSGSKVVYKTKTIPVSPLPLVFDSPGGIDYWAYTFSFNFTTDKGNFNLIADKQVMKQVRRGWFLHIFFHYVFASPLVNDYEVKNLTMIKNLACQGMLQSYLFNDAKVYKIDLHMISPTGDIVGQRSFLCL